MWIFLEINELKPYVDTLLVISNDKLRVQYGNLKMKEAFTKADNVLATAAKCITDAYATSLRFIHNDYIEGKKIKKEKMKNGRKDAKEMTEEEKEKKKLDKKILQDEKKELNKLK